MNNLFSEITIKNKMIKNRIVMPPMVCFGWAGNDGFVTEKHLDHYDARARGGVGLIIIEATCVEKDGRLSDSQLGVWSDDHIEGLSRIAERCHKHGAKVLVQIHHAGLKTYKAVSSSSIAPSNYSNEKVSARAMTIDELHYIQKCFIEAAARVKKAGMDGIELHGAHGYLICQFMSPLVNKRQDEYGGSIENRMRFALEIIEGIKKETDNDFIIGYRMGGNEPTLEEGIKIAETLEKHSIDLLHVSSGIGGDNIIEVPSGFEYNSILYGGTEIKKHVNIPVIVVNDIRTPERAEYLIENNMTDLTAIGKELLADPEWANEAREGINIEACLRCKRCQWFTNGERCPRVLMRDKIQV